MLNYKGYNAIIKLDPISKILKGKVIDLNDSLTFEGEEVEKLIVAFHNTVDSYLEFCEELGQKPEKPFGGTITYRTDSETHRKIVTAAAKAGLSVNSLIDSTIKEAIENSPEDAPSLVTC